jgi:phosphatidylinositol alpha-1,6-mannosyltransferase
MPDRVNSSLLITNDFPPTVSGIGTVFYNLFRLQPKESFSILCPQDRGYENFDRKDNMSVIRVRIPSGESIISKVIKTLSNLIYIFIYAIRPKVKKLHCGQILSNGIAGFLCKKILKIPYVIWVYGSETIRFGNTGYLSFIMKKILSSAELIIVNSSFTQEEYIRFGADKEKLFKITPGVDTVLFRPTDKPVNLMKKYNLYGKTVLLTVARLDERKGQDMIIETLYLLKKEYANIVYLIVGKGREEKRLRQMVHDKGLQDSVIFTGYVPDEDIPDYYNLCDIFVLPNRETENASLKGDYEGFGTVFLEANACGKPVIGGMSGGVRDAIEQGITGFLVNPRSIEEVKEAVKSLICDPQRRLQMGLAGRLRAEKYFDWKIISKKLEKIL